MKLLLFFVLTLSFLTAFSQTNFDEQDLINKPVAYKFINASARVYPANEMNSNNTKNKIDSIRYKIVGSTKHFVMSGQTKMFDAEKYYLIRFWEIKSDSNNLKNNPNSVNSADNGTYFYLAEKDFLTQTVERYSKRLIFEIGFTTIPFRYRFGNRSKNRSADIELTSISALPTFGVKKRISKDSKYSFIGLLTGFGIANSNIDSASFPQSSPNRIEYRTPKNVSNLNIIVGFFYQIRRGQVVLAIGKELVSKDLRDWAYKKSIFFSIGIGIPLFSVGNTPTGGTDKEKDQ